MKFIAISIFALILLATNLLIGEADELPSEYVLSTHQVMVRASTEFHAPYEQIRMIGTCESSLNQDTVGQAGEIGMYQFKRDTFRRMSAEMGENLDINSYYDQTRLISWVWTNRPQWKSQWSCAYITGILKR